MRAMHSVKFSDGRLRIRGFSTILIGKSKVADSLFFSPSANLNSLWMRNIGGLLVIRPQSEDIAGEHMDCRVVVTTERPAIDPSVAPLERELAIWVPGGTNVEVFDYSDIDAIQAPLGSVWATTNRKSTGNFSSVTSLFATIRRQSYLGLGNLQGGPLIVTVEGDSRFEMQDPSSSFESISAAVDLGSELNTTGTVVGNYTVVGQGKRNHVGKITGATVGLA